MYALPRHCCVCLCERGGSANPEHPSGPHPCKYIYFTSVIDSCRKSPTCMQVYDLLFTVDLNS